MQTMVVTRETAVNRTSRNLQGNAVQFIFAPWKIPSSSIFAEGAHNIPASFSLV
jgi:hypothetical protein